MKAVLEFNLPDDKYEFDSACRATDLIQVIRGINDEFRRVWKYSDDSVSDERIAEAERLQKFLWELIEDAGCGNILE
jgi:hypothetical protein